MKHIYVLVVLVLSFVFALPVRAEKVHSFFVFMQVHADSTVSVKETITYDFESARKHGIFRTIPLAYLGKFGSSLTVPITDISVHDEKDKPYPFTETRNGDGVTIKIGDPNMLVSGSRQYIIDYTIKRSITYFDDHDELYWNVTGNSWQVPIEAVQATVYLPQNFISSVIRADCFAGYAGSTSPCSNKRLLTNPNGTVFGVAFNSEPLSANEGFTFALGWPVGVVYKPNFLQVLWQIALDNKIIFLPFLVFAALYYLWWKRGRDPEGKDVIIPQYDAPDALTPLEVGTIVDEGADTKDVSAEIVYLATKGYLKINRIESGTVLKTVDYQLDQLKGPSDLKEAFDTRLWQLLFGSGTNVKISDLKYKVSKEVEDVKTLAYAAATAKGYFPKNPQKVRNVYISTGAGALVVLYLLSGWVGFSAITVGALILSVAMVFLFGYRMPRKSEKGVAAKEHILGLKLYLSVAEEARINFHNAPEKNPQQFEKFLPFAMVLGVEKEWAVQFESLALQNPSWYNDPAHVGAFNVALFTRNLGSFSSAVSSTFVAQASKGGSGFSGGGSGGGFGGGGGGSW